DVVDLEFEQELDFTLILAAGALLPGAALLGGIREYIARLGLTLSGALLFLGAAQPEVVMLQHTHRHANRPRAFVDDISAGDYLGEVLADRLTNFLIVPQPVARTARKQVVPLVRTRSRLIGAFGHVLVVLLDRAVCNSPWSAPQFQCSYLLLREQCRYI